MQDARISKCLAAKRESKSVEFKEQFIPTDARQSLEVLKDIVAMANSGGGTLAVGINNSGIASGVDIDPVLKFDHAKYCDLIRKYTLQNFSDLEVIEAEKDGHSVAIFLINPPDFPLVFERPGTYAIENSSRQATAFGQGTVFFRHGAKSEPGTGDDLRRFMQQRMKEMERQILSGMRQVTEAPRGSQLQVIPAGKGRKDLASAVGVRLTTDKNALGVIPVDRGKLCPYRKKELMSELRRRLPKDLALSPYDIQAVNRVFKVSSKEDFCWQPEYSSPQYSDVYVHWLVEKITSDVDFLRTAREKYYEMNHS
jgi:Schlafen, AlbA_2